MKIELVKTKINSSRGYKYKPFRYCCDKLKEITVIQLSDECPDESDMCDEDGYIPQFMIHNPEIIFSYDDEWTQDYYYPIKFCPFCGKPIDIEVIATEDKTEYCNRLKEERDAVWNLCQKTDSKHDEQVLLNRRNQLDDLINNFYAFGEYKEEQSD